MSERLVFGKHSKEDAERLWGADSPNPCVRGFGRGPQEKICKDCIHLVENRQPRAYTRCAMRLNTKGYATEHRRYWAACAKFEPAKKIP